MASNGFVPRQQAAPAIGLALIALAAGIAAPRAEAASYTARFCVDGLTANEDRGPFDRDGNETVFSLNNNCGSANGLRVSQNSGAAGNDGVFGRWLAQRPDGVTVSKIDYKAKGADQSGGYFPQVVGTVSAGELGVINGGQELDGTYRPLSVTGDVRRFGVQLVCQTGGSQCAASPSGNPEAALKDITYTLDDPSAPQVAVTGGSLFAGPVQAGTQTIGFDSSDAGAGVARAFAVVNGDDTQGARAKCEVRNGVAVSFLPCPGSFGSQISVDTTAGPWRNGTNRVRTCVEDYAGTRACTASRKVRVLNGCTPNGAPANSGVTMTMGWPGKRGVVRSRQGRARKATVQLFGPGTTPLAGAAVCFSRSIPTSDKQGVERVLAPGAVTGPGGKVALKVRGQSSRTVYATYWTGPDTAITKRIRLEVSPAIRLELRAAKRPEAGDRVRVVALLRGKFKANRNVCFYATGPGNDKFACDETGAGGRARVAFKAKHAGKVAFYARVPNQRDYPYSRGRSARKALHFG